ncbi:GTP 3',8-cyclase MoaA [Leptolinea tardivitalis]|uniref:GTP 3',8-cyclase n=1 Tax=Leptolinea tardivitalis TaxID=229920 RepID=A0A0P6XCF1_9CHLR|nr:GTP 3',8-cyclase MoaA [Leptolinea tardivitalis]KPL72911.1 molybdenum cofactor biosynthesis protein MoeA [Leptolinea tardivitalis]GAP20695.1 cyclic pyranopterin monophosphate synthase subunit MoaA [Leptolinea tardivitalis]
MLIDHYGRAITYLRMSITDRCNLRCAYCQPASGLDWIPDDQRLTKDDFIRLARVAAALGITKIRLTGGEPLVNPDILEITAQIAAIPGIEDLSLTSNAILLGKLAGPLADAGLKRVNISLDTLHPEKYRRVTRFGDFDQAWQGILAAEKAGLLPLKLNTVVVGGFNDDEIPELARLSIDHPWHIRFIELMPVANSQDWGGGFPPVDQRYVSVQTMHEKLADLSLVPEATPPNAGPERMFRIPGAAGTVGFIAPLGEHFCARCNRLRLTADGRLRSCLLVDKEISVRDALKSGADLKLFIQKAVEEKPRGHKLEEHNCPDSRCMSQIGG